MPDSFTDSMSSTCHESLASAAESSPPVHKGPHRDGFTIDKCRTVLIKHCSWIPRNYTYRDGVSKVYAILREYLGDENMDLATAQLDELIEVPSEWASDEDEGDDCYGALLTMKQRDLENSHVPSLGNVIVAPVLPTSRLKKWREDNPGHDRSTLSSAQSLQRVPSITREQNTPIFGIGARVRRSEWKLENALFVSSRAKGTQVLNLPTAQELHARTWDSEFGRGGKLVHERDIPVGDMTTLPNSSSQVPQLVEARNSLLSLRSVPSIARLAPARHIRAMNLELSALTERTWLGKARSRFIKRQIKQSGISDEDKAVDTVHPQDPLVGRFSEAVRDYETDPMAECLPDTGDDIGKAYYQNVPTQPLPSNFIIPNARFARKHCLADKDEALPAETQMGRMPTADELAIQKNFQNAAERFSKNGTPRLTGPLTPELFRDGGIDFIWGINGRTVSVVERDIDILSDVASLGDSNQSPMKCMTPISQCLESDLRRVQSLSSDTGESRHRHDPCEPMCRPMLHDLVRADLASRLDTAQVQRDLEQNNLTSSTLWQDKKNQLRTELARKGWRVRSQSLPFPLKRTQTFAPTYRKSRLIDFRVLAQSSSPLSQILAFIEIEKFLKERKMECLDGDGAPITTAAVTMMDQQQKLTTDFDNKMAPEDLVHQDSFNLALKEPLFRVLKTKSPISSSTVNTAGSTVMQGSPSQGQDSIVGAGSGRISFQATMKETDSAWEALWKEVDPEETISSRANDDEQSKDVNRHSDGEFEYPGEDILKSSPRSVAENPLAVDLNRDLPPLPHQVPIQPLNIRKPTENLQVLSHSVPEGETLRPDRYDPVKDGSKYGGTQYFHDKIRYSPEVDQYPPRISSMKKTNLPGKPSADNRPERLEMTEGRNTSSAARPVALDSTMSGYLPDASSGIMGNFMPVKGAGFDLTARTDSGQGPSTHTRPKRGVASDLESMNDRSSVDKDESEHLEDLKRNRPDQYKEHTARASVLSEYSDIGSLNVSSGNRMAGQTSVESKNDGMSSPYACKEYQELSKRNPYKPEYNNFDSGLFSPNNFDSDYFGSNNSGSKIFGSNSLNSSSQRVTTFGDFIQGENVSEPVKLQSFRKQGHLKNSYSESNALYIAKQPELTETVNTNKAGQPLQRSDSSPSMLVNRFAGSRAGAVGLLRTPTRGRTLSRLSESSLENLTEMEVASFQTPPTAHKRSASPVKRFFGEIGLLGSSGDSKDPSSPKKPGLVRRVKLKIEEFASKADFSPRKNTPKTETEQTLVAISIKPAQQAELYHDIELIICDTANTFLMHEYQSCRMSVESLKKITDFWKSKGRPQVLEFHYDQLTQRDFIVENKKWFQFRGPNSGDELKISSMLYNWKSIAREMAIRTYCYPDAMIRKHIRDTLMILDFLGGHPVQYLGLHEVQAKFVAWTNDAEKQGRLRGATEPVRTQFQPVQDAMAPQLGLDRQWQLPRGPTTATRTQRNRSRPSL